MKKAVRRTVMILLAAVFAGSVAMLIHRGIEYRQGEETYAEAEQLVGLPDLSALEVPEVSEAPPEDPETEEAAPVYADPYADALRNMDFTALREVNPDILGWILIPDTAISYPLVQGDDNQYYLNHTWKKWTSAVGAIFLECQNSADLSDFNTIVYGHRMNNGSMFASLKYYSRQSYWSAHPCVYVMDDYGSHKYDVFAAYEVSTSGSTYQIGFSGEASRQAFLDACMERSVIETGIIPTVNDRILTLSTCTGNGHATRWVVQAVLRGVASSDAAEEAAAAETAPTEGAPAAAETLPEEEAPAMTAETAPGEEVPAMTAETAPEEEAPAAGEDAQEPSGQTQTP